MAEFMGAVHEPSEFTTEIGQLRDVFAKHRGVSDSGLGFWLDWILHEIQPRTLIIERDIVEVEDSLLRLNTGFPQTNYCELLRDALNRFKTNPLVMMVNFNDMNKLCVMQKVFWHLKPGEAFDEGRFMNMRNVNIQRNMLNLSRGEESIYDWLKPFIKVKE